MFIGSDNNNLYNMAFAAANIRVSSVRCQNNSSAFLINLVSANEW